MYGKEILRCICMLLTMKSGNISSLDHYIIPFPSMIECPRRVQHGDYGDDETQRIVIVII